MSDLNCLKFTIILNYYKYFQAPSFGRLKTWKNIECNGLVYVWYHSEKVEPYWDPIKLPQINNHDNENGNWISPTVIADLDVNSRCSTEEIFGPVVTIHKFTNEEEAIEIANNTRYGLAGSIWTNDIEKGNRVAESIHTGMIWINTWLHRDLSLIHI